MKNYLGETPVDMQSHPEFAKYEMKDWALLWIEKFGGFDGAHHKDWVLDQVSQILHGATVTIHEAKWKCEQSEYRFTLQPNAEYDAWVDSFEGNYDTGIAP